MDNENFRDSTKPTEITAEVLANMYDKSLDQFVVNTYSWQKSLQQTLLDFSIRHQ